MRVSKMAVNWEHIDSFLNIYRAKLYVLYVYIHAKNILKLGKGKKLNCTTCFFFLMCFDQYVKILPICESQIRSQSEHIAHSTF